MSFSGAIAGENAESEPSAGQALHRCAGDNEASTPSRDRRPAGYARSGFEQLAGLARRGMTAGLETPAGPGDLTVSVAVRNGPVPSGGWASSRRIGAVRSVHVCGGGRWISEARPRGGKSVREVSAMAQTGGRSLLVTPGSLESPGIPQPRAAERTGFFSNRLLLRTGSGESQADHIDFRPPSGGPGRVDCSHSTTRAPHGTETTTRRVEETIRSP